MKKPLCLILALVLMLVPAGCSDSVKDGGASTNGEESSIQSEAPQQSEISSPEESVNAFEFLGDADLVPLEGGKNFHSKYTIEIDGTIIFAGQYGELALFDAESGKKLCETTVEGGYVIRLDEYTDKPGYDYRLIMEDRVVYRSTADCDKELVEKLPNGLVFDHAGFPCEVKSVYDINEEAFVWASDEGIMLSGLDGSNPRLILSNSDLSDISALLTDVDLEFVFDYGFSFLYQDPRFILDGAKIVSGIISQEGIYYGIVLFDIFTGKIDLSYGFPEPDRPIYPVDDRRIAVQSSFSCIIIDALTGESEKSSERFPVRSVYTKDYQTAVVCYYGLDGSRDLMDFRNLRAYVCDMGELGDKSNPLVFVADPDTEASLSVISKNYALVSVSSGTEKPNPVYAVRYGKP